MRTLYVQGWFLLPDGFEGTKADALRLLAQYEETTPDPPLTASQQSDTQELGSFASKVNRALEAFGAGKRMCMAMSIATVDQWRCETEARIACFVTVRSCARCGDDHCELPFEELTRPDGDYSLWAACPKNGQPILLNVAPL